MSVIEFEERKVVLATSLWKQGAIKFGAFKLKLHERFPDAPLSPIYLNLRMSDNPKPGSLSREDVYLAARLMFESVVWRGDPKSKNRLMSLDSRFSPGKWEETSTSGLVFDYVAGIPNAGTPFASAMCRMIVSELGVQQLHLQKITDGEKRMISGLVEGTNDGSVLVIDDLITHAESKIEAFDSIKAAGLTVAALVVLVDREQGGADEVRKLGIPFISVFTLSELLQLYVSQGFMTEAMCEEVRQGIFVLDEYVASHECAA